MLELYQYEECPACRIVRQKLSELGLDYLCRNAPWGRPDKDRVLLAISGDTRVPFLVDSDEGVYLANPMEIVEYLEERYGPRVRERLGGTPVPGQLAIKSAGTPEPIREPGIQ
jgi:glutathione S-transferase